MDSRLTIDQAASEAARRVRNLPLWRGPVEPESLPGGISNRSFRVRDGSDVYAVRLVDGDIPEHGIVRDHEIAVSRAAHAAGIAPELVFADRDILVLRFIEGRTLRQEDVRARPMLERIALLLRRCHRQVAAHLRAPARSFCAFQAMRDYLVLLARDGRLARRLEGLHHAIDKLEHAVGAMPPAVTHNDLMPGNLIDDGDRLWLIDWEYGGFGVPLFDLATLAVNNSLDAAARQHLLAAYCGRPPEADLQHRFAAMALAARLRESLWARIQEIHGRLAFDYRAYADEHEARFEQEYASAGL